MDIRQFYHNMRVKVILSSNPLSYSSASSNRLLSLLEGLVKYKVKVDLSIYGPYKSMEEYITFGKKGIVRGISYSYVGSAIIKNGISLRLYNYLGEFFLYYFIRRRYLSESLGDIGKVVYWLESDLNGFKLASFLRKYNKDIYVFTDISEYTDLYKYNRGNIVQKIKSRLRHRFFIKKSIFDFSLIIIMTRPLIRRLKEYNAGLNYIHLPMTVDLSRFDYSKIIGSGPSFDYIAFVGVMNDAKEGVSDLIEAFKIVKETHGDIKLMLVGGFNIDSKRHSELVATMGLINDVIFAGHRKREDIPLILKNARVLILPRPKSIQAEGGFPTKLGEYLASGTPVISSQVGEIPYYLENKETVFFFKTGSINSLASTIKFVLDNKDFAERVGCKGASIAKENFDCNKQSKKLLEFLIKELE